MNNYVKSLANYIFNKTPLLNFAETNNAQIVSGQFNIKTLTYSPMHKGFKFDNCLLYTSPSPRDVEESRMPSSA